jgi:hypothetical protein
MNDIRALLSGLHFFMPPGGDKPITVELTLGHKAACTAIAGPSVIIRAITRPDGSLAVGTIERNLSVPFGFTPKCRDVPATRGEDSLPA